MSDGIPPVDPRNTATGQHPKVESTGTLPPHVVTKQTNKDTKPQEVPGEKIYNKDTHSNRLKGRVTQDAKYNPILAFIFKILRMFFGGAQEQFNDVEKLRQEWGSLQNAKGTEAEKQNKILEFINRVDLLLVAANTTPDGTSLAPDREKDVEQLNRLKEEANTKLFGQIGVWEKKLGEADADTKVDTRAVSLFKLYESVGREQERLQALKLTGTIAGERDGKVADLEKLNAKVEEAIDDRYESAKGTLKGTISEKAKAAKTAITNAQGKIEAFKKDVDSKKKAMDSEDAKLEELQSDQWTLGTEETLEKAKALQFEKVVQPILSAWIAKFTSLGKEIEAHENADKKQKNLENIETTTTQKLTSSEAIELADLREASEARKKSIEDLKGRIETGREEVIEKKKNVAQPFDNNIKRVKELLGLIAKQQEIASQKLTEWSESQEALRKLETTIQEQQKIVDAEADSLSAELKAFGRESAYRSAFQAYKTSTERGSDPLIFIQKHVAGKNSDLEAQLTKDLSELGLPIRDKKVTDLLSLDVLYNI